MIFKIIKKIQIKLSWWSRVVLSYFGIKRKYFIGKYFLYIDYIHRMPDYRQDHKLYNKFLPHIIKYLEPNTVIVDIGSNVGDTLVEMINSTTNFDFVCIEANEKTYQYLEENINVLNKQVSNLNIYKVNEFVGKDLNNISLIDYEGTSKVNLKKQGLKQSKNLKLILDNLNIKKNISLIKLDTDGHDFDAINSFSDDFNSDPLIFFECFYENDNQLNGYLEMFPRLTKKGYDNFSFFDNFGQYIMTTNNFKEIKELLFYIYNQFDKDSTRTFFYYDVLAYNKKKHTNIPKAINHYIKLLKNN